MKTAEKPLTGTQKAAVVLMQMDRAAASAVMSKFTDLEAEEITAEIMRLRRVSPDVADSVMTEFHDMVTSGRTHARGGRDIAADLLEATFGAEKAAGLMNRMASAMAGKSFEFLEDVEPGQVITLVDGELPQTIALVLAHLRPQVASAVLAGLSDETRTDVAQAIATMGTATPESVSTVAEIVKSRAGAVVSPREVNEVVGGIQPLVDIINRSDITTEKSVLEGLQERDPELAEEVRSRMLTFADIVKLEPRDIQQVLRGIDLKILATAMKGAPAAVIEAIEKNVSERNREALQAEITATGAVRMSQIEEARAEVVRSIRELEAAGTITVRRGDEDDVVY